MDIFSPEETPTAAELIAGHDGLRADAQAGLLFGGVPLAAIARAYGTPCWVYEAGVVRARYRALAAAMRGIRIHYAVKANDHLAILAILAAEGAGADVVSAGELRRARAVGIAAGQIIFSGVGKSAAELDLALAEAIGQINVESAEELAMLSARAVACGAVARVALRVNPDIDAGTHDKIATGRAGDKFGIPFDQAAALYEHGAALPGIAMVGLALHIGSQIHSATPFAAAYRRVASLVRALRARGLAVQSVDCGGGLGVAYAGEPACLPQAWGAAIAASFAGLDLRLAIEPGRWLVAPAGVLLASVVRTRRAGLARPIMVLDAAMNDLARPAMYGAWHGIVPVGAACLHAPAVETDIVGPVCESSDIFARARPIAGVPDQGVVAILDAGAYGAVMSSSYNARPPAAQVLIDATLPDAPGGFTLIRARPDVAQLWADELVPVWAGAGAAALAGDRAA